MCLEEDGKFQPYTRDTFSYAIKATYGERNGEPVMIMKQPKALAWKKSQRGCVHVAPDGQSYIDNLTFEQAHIEMGGDNLLQLVFEDGSMVRNMTLNEVRANMYPGGF
jgi:nicotinamide phosphoribosyltransferase